MTAAFQILLDVPTEKPALDFDRYAQSFKEIIEQSPPRFAIGVFGGWGSGKTTLMQAVESKLDRSRCLPVQFSAWRYEKEGHLIVPLLDSIREALVAEAQQNQTIKDVAVRTASTIGKVVHSLVAGLGMKVGLPGTFQISIDANKALTKAKNIDDEDARVPKSFYHASFNALQGAFSEFIGGGADRRIVIFVDDLDRCLPEGALSVLESMKLFFDFPGFIFVVGLDRKVVVSAINLRYARENEAGKNEETESFRIEGAEYIKKIFQVPFSLFPVSAADIDPFLEAVYSTAGLSDEQTKELREHVRPHLDYLVTEDGLNPREIKRFINSYTLIRKLKPSLVPAVILALETIYARTDWSTAKGGLLGYRRLFLEALASGDHKDLVRLNPRFEEIPPSFLDYVRKPNPGAPLVGAANIDDYIYAGEAARSSEGGTRVSDLIRKVTALRDLVATAAHEGPSSTAQSELRSAAEELTIKVREYVSGSSAFLSSASKRIEDLKATSVPEKGDREEWAKVQNERISEVVADLMEWSRVAAA